MLLKEIRAVASETLVLSPHDQAAENVNTNWFGAPPHERMGMTVEEVVAAFEETAGLLREQVAALAHDGPVAFPVTFYVWHEPIAGQLRCSVGSCAHDGLPFTDPYTTTADLRAIVVEFLEDRAPGAIVWGEMEPVPFPDDDASGPAPARPAVWVCSLRP